MTIRFIGTLLCGGLLALALTTEARAFWYIPGTDTCMKVGKVARGNSCVERGRARLKSTKGAVKPQEPSHRGKLSAEHLKV
jgi:Porin subfamily